MPVVHELRPATAGLGAAAALAPRSRISHLLAAQFIDSVH